MTRTPTATFHGVLDAWTVISVLRGDPSAARARNLLRRGVVMSSVNLGEVYCALARSHGREVAEDRVRAVRETLRVEDPDWPFVVCAAQLAADGKMALADAFCVASAERHQAPIYTIDPVMLALDLPVPVLDLRGT